MSPSPVSSFAETCRASSGTARVTTPGGPGQPTAGAIDGTHTYQREGTYTVTVTVTDRDGASDTKTFRIAVATPGLLTAAADAGGSPVAAVFAGARRGRWAQLRPKAGKIRLFSLL